MTTLVTGAQYGYSYTSKDQGASWSNRRLSSSSIASVMCGGSPQQFIATVTNPGAVFTSPDGVHWTSRSVPALPGPGPAAYSPQLGLYALGSYSGGTILTSPDAITWTARATPAGSNDMITAVAWSDTVGLFVAVGSTGTILTSPDASTWTKRSNGSTSTLYRLVWAPVLGVFLASTTSGWMSRSSYGYDWTPLSYGTSGAPYTWVPPLGLFVSCPQYGSWYTSPDGLTWTRSYNSAVPTYSTITWSEDWQAIVVAGSAGSWATSTDAATWTARTAISSYSVTALAFSTTPSPRPIVGSTEVRFARTLPIAVTFASATSVDASMSLGQQRSLGPARVDSGTSLSNSVRALSGTVTGATEVTARYLQPAGRAAGVFAFGHLAIRGVANTGRVDGHFAVTGTAHGYLPTNHADGTYAFAGAAAGHIDTSGEVAGYGFAVTGATAGHVVATGQAAGTYAFAASPVRGVSVVGRTPGGTFSFTATVRGVGDPNTASGTFGFGTGEVTGSSPNGSVQVWYDGYYDPYAGVWVYEPFLFTFDGNASGSVPGGSGTGSGGNPAFAFAGAAVGAMAPHGEATGTHDWTVDYTAPHADLDLDAAYGADRWDAPVFGTDRFTSATGTDRWDYILTPEKGSN